MSNPLYQQMKPQGGNNMIQALNSLRKNPFQFIAQRGLNIPQNISNDPNAIIKHLMNTGQVSQEHYNQVMQQIQSFKR